MVGKDISTKLLFEEVAPPNCQPYTFHLIKNTETKTNLTENPFTNDLFGGFRRINGLVLEGNWQVEVWWIICCWQRQRWAPKVTSYVSRVR